MGIRLCSLATSTQWSLIVFSCLAAFDAHAALPQRTFVASTGLDTNACTVAAPCRSFTTAMGQVADGGEVIVLDSAGYGPVVITKSVSIVAPPGVYAGISVQGAGTNGIEINTAGIVVVLRGLTINGLGGDHGIRFQNGTRVTVENCIVTGMSVNGLFADAPGSRLTVRDSRFRHNGDTGAAVVGDVVAEFERVQADGNSGSGFDISDGARASLKSVSAQQNFLYGVKATAALATTTEILVDDSQFVSGQSGVYAFSSGGVVLVSIARTTVMHVDNTAVFANIPSPPGTIRIVVKDSVLFRNSGGGIAALGVGTIVIADGNVITDSNGYGMQSFFGGIVLSRQNNTSFGNSLGDMAPAPLGAI